ncbi:MAG: DUF1501 domain-containing protein [Alphaproteobacteria bacterium]|nr:DUF1501 domain-containing protein [Alphaproteobacteria bacterium]
MITIARRTLLKHLGLAGLSASAAAAFPSLSLAAAPTERRFVVVLLRGAMDGLSAVPPHGDPSYAKARGPIAIGSPGSGEGAALKLDGLFALHPRLKAMKALYDADEAAVVHAVASPYRDRSHFDGQDVVENGGAAPKQQTDGWLNRALKGYGRKDANRALAVSQAMPLILTGSEQVSSWTPPRLPTADEDYFTRVRRMYQGDGELGQVLEDALATRAMAQGAMQEDSGRMARPGAYGGGQLSVLTRPAGALLRADQGARFAVLDPGGWDTHANQGAAQGTLAQRLGDLDDGLAALKDALGPVWADTVVVVVTEFGRTVAVNGSNGTDHGTASAAFVLGGAVRGGQVVADWPGLAPGQQFQGRDLNPTFDMRALFKTALVGHMGLEEGFVDREVLKGGPKVAAIGELLRS